MNTSDINLQKAIDFVAFFYDITEETVKELYMDEVQEYLWLLNKEIENE